MFNGIKSPWYSGPIEQTAFNLYAMNEERRSKIEKVIEYMVAAGAELCNDFEVQCEIYNKVGIDSDTFTYQEEKYIEGEVSKRFGFI